LFLVLNNMNNECDQKFDHVLDHP